jgi:protein involved in polysaccharide export with SLBB domain
MRLVSVLFVGLALWILPAGAQTTTMGGPPDPTDPFFTPTAACSGPLGSLIPECQPKNGVEGLLNPGRGGGAVPPANVRIPGAKDSDASLTPPEPPQPPTEFQRFVASSVGQILPIFGASLFDKAPTTFAPLDRVPVTSDYVVGPGDELLLRVWGQVSLNAELTVDRAGAVFVPQVGAVNVTGLQFQQLSGYLRSQLGRVYRNFDLTVNMGQLRSIQIFVVGQARRPGTYTVSSLSTLVNALFASGGPSSQGSMRRIQLKRGAQVVTEFDLYDLLLNGDKSKDARLLPGDVVYIPSVGPQIAAAGSVRTPAIYEINGEKTAGELIRMAGGLSALADAKRATLERINQRTSRETLQLHTDAAGLATPVSDGDVLNLLAIMPRFSNAVTLRGNVANPGRFPWRAGMRLRDVIPDKESLVTQDYWKKRNVLGFTPPDVGVAPEPAAETRRKPAATNVDLDVPDINWSYAVIERQNPTDLSTQLISFHLGKLILENDEQQNLEVQPGDVITIFSQADIRVAVAQQTRFVRLEGEFGAAGIYAVKPGETLAQLLQRAGGLTPQAYLYGAEFTRESTRLDQQRRLDDFTREMEKEVQQSSTRQIAGANPEEVAAAAAKLESDRHLIERLRLVKATGRIVLNLEPGDASLSKAADFPLEDGDRFMVPVRPATVNVLGAVYNQNSFLHEASFRIADYLQEAGGPSRDADKGRIFVIRADGSVLPKQGFSPFSRSFDSALLNPGDSIVVPEALARGSFMHGLRDWTQVFAQLALGAAAINVLK